MALTAGHSNGTGLRRRVVVLGATGSVGTSCLDVARKLGDRLEIVGMSAHSNWQTLFDHAQEFRPRWVAVTCPKARAELPRSQLPAGTTLLDGEDGIAHMVSQPEVDVVLTAIVGAAGLHGTWAALEAGKTIALANKETLVMAGPLVMDLARRHGAALLPVDSEHSAIFQAMLGGRREEVERVVLTASGGPFRGKTAADLMDVKAEHALQHPTWRMGPKITVDSATLMNKALEVIEARWLFQLEPEQIDVVIHPQSMIHSFVEFRDGSVLAQLSPPDMRLPIQYALLYPDRVPGPTRRLNWREMGPWQFEQPNRETFPALDLGFEVARKGGSCGAVLNAANEASVGRFLANELRFLDIPRVCREVLANHNFSPHPSLNELRDLDRWARREVSHWK
ncbi:MAG TPA: 1-deoxy-D-xylulose-5-phosphate reductoisomerase [Gemmataceae bacterium]|nr:1-deoxy-D-xylulose-5-phosphate reductoisomerase [Gemmataceae bacterium]